MLDKIVVEKEKMEEMLYNNLIRVLTEDFINSKN